MVHQPSSKGMLVAALAVLAVLALVPQRWGRWANSIGNAALLITAPVTQPIYQSTAWLMGSPGTENTSALAAAQRERDQFRTLWLQEQSRVRELERTIVELQKGSLAAELPVQQLIRKVIGGSSDGSGGQIQIRTGTRDGTEVNTVVTTGGVQLVGKVVRVSSRVSEARLITDVKAGYIGGVIMLPGEVRGPRVNLHPIGDGRLQGYVEYGAGQGAELGQVVRLEDEQWPRSARMLVLGTVIDVDKSLAGRQRIIVKPTVELARLSEVVLRVTPMEAEDRIAAQPEGPGLSPGRGSTDGARP